MKHIIQTEENSAKNTETFKKKYYHNDSNHNYQNDDESYNGETNMINDITKHVDLDESYTLSQENNDDLSHQLYSMQKKIRSIEAKIKRPQYDGLNIDHNTTDKNIKKTITHFIKTGKIDQNSDNFASKSLTLSQHKPNTLVLDDKVNTMVFSSGKYNPFTNYTNHIYTHGSCNVVANRPNLQAFNLNTINLANLGAYQNHQRQHQTMLLKQFSLLDTIIVHDDMRQAKNVDDILYSQLLSRIINAQNNLFILGRGDEQNEPQGILSYPRNANPNPNDFTTIKNVQSTMQDMENNPVREIVNLYSALGSEYVNSDTKICMSYKMLNILRRHRQQNAGHAFGLVNERLSENNEYVFSILGYEVVIVNQLSGADFDYILFMNGKEFYTSTSSDIELFIDDSMNRPFRTIGIQTAIGGMVTNTNAGVLLEVINRNHLDKMDLQEQQKSNNRNDKLEEDVE